MIFSIRGPRRSRPFPWDRFFILSRFLTVSGPVDCPRGPKIAKNLPSCLFYDASMSGAADVDDDRGSLSTSAATVEQEDEGGVPPRAAARPSAARPLSGAVVGAGAGKCCREREP